MLISSKKSQFHLTRPLLAIVIIFCFLSNIIIFPVKEAIAQVHFLPPAGTMISLSNGFQPLLVKGIRIFPENPLRFDFIIDTGDAQLPHDQLKEESTKLIKYFLASLTVPEDQMWVNLSPFEKERIIPDQFGQTEMGRDLLAQDYLLKQITASLIYPENDLGKAFWNRVHEKTKDTYGDANIPVDTFNKVWIVPETATVYENKDVAFVTESHLKVLLEEDYLASRDQVSGVSHQISEARNDKLTADSRKLTAVLRDTIIPEIEKEVNEGENFATLRQIYHSMILATWFKKNLRESILGKIYVNQNKIDGVEVEDKEIKEKIYDQYLKAFQQGVYNFIKEEYDSTTQETIPRKYFSGGFFGDMQVFKEDGRAHEVTVEEAMVASVNLVPERDSTQYVETDDDSMTPKDRGSKSRINKEEVRKAVDILRDSFVQVPQDTPELGETVILEHLHSDLLAMEARKKIKETIRLRNGSSTLNVNRVDDEKSRVRFKLESSIKVKPHPGHDPKRYPRILKAVSLALDMFFAVDKDFQEEIQRDAEDIKPLLVSENYHDYYMTTAADILGDLPENELLIKIRKYFLKPLPGDRNRIRLQEYIDSDFMNDVINELGGKSGQKPNLLQLLTDYLMFVYMFERTQNIEVLKDILGAFVSTHGSYKFSKVVELGRNKIYNRNKDQWYLQETETISQLDPQTTDFINVHASQAQTPKAFYAFIQNEKQRGVDLSRKVYFFHKEYRWHDLSYVFVARKGLFEIWGASETYSRVAGYNKWRRIEAVEVVPRNNKMRTKWITKPRVESAHDLSIGASSKVNELLPQLSRQEENEKNIDELHDLHLDLGLTFGARGVIISRDKETDEPVFDDDFGFEIDLSRYEEKGPYPSQPEQPESNNLPLLSQEAKLKHLNSRLLSSTEDDSMATAQKPYQKPPASMHFLIADLKLKEDGTIKILEFGDGLSSAFQGYSEVNDGNPMYALLWKHLENLGLPIWITIDQLQAIITKQTYFDHIASNSFPKRNESEAGSIDRLEESIEKGLFGAKKDNFDPRDLSTYSAAVVDLDNDLTSKTIEDFREKYPWLLLMNEISATRGYVGDKVMTRLLLSRENFDNYSPGWKLMRTKYHADMAQEIMRDMPSEKYIIKPVSSSMGRGILAVAAKDLDQTLQKILTGDKEAEKKRIQLEEFRFFNDHNPYEFWLGNDDPLFLIETVENSKPTRVEGKDYDGVLRMAFVLSESEGEIALDFLDGYWKLPGKSLGDADLHSTLVTAGVKREGEAAVPLNENDKQKVITHLEKILPQIYGKTLEQDFDAMVDSLLSSEDEKVVAYGILRARWIKNFTPSRIQKLLELARLKNNDYDVAFLDIIKNPYHRKEKQNLFPILSELLHSNVPEVREQTMKRILDNLDVQGMKQIALSFKPKTHPLSNLVTKAQYFSFLADEKLLDLRDLLREFEKIFEEEEYESQKFILKNLMKKKLIFKSPWIWKYLQDENTLLFARWFDLLMENQETFFNQAKQEGEYGDSIANEYTQGLSNITPTQIIKLLQISGRNQRYKLTYNYIQHLNQHALTSGEVKLRIMASTLDRTTMPGSNTFQMYKIVKELTEEHLSEAPASEHEKRIFNTKNISQATVFFVEAPIEDTPSTSSSEDSKATVTSFSRGDESMDAETVGGIDLNPSSMTLKSEGEGIDFKLPFDLEEFQQTPINGFRPVIFNIAPVTNLPLLLGISEEEIPKDQPLARRL